MLFYKIVFLAFCFLQQTREGCIDIFSERALQIKSLLLKSVIQDFEFIKLIKHLHDDFISLPRPECCWWSLL